MKEASAVDLKAYCRTEDEVALKAERLQRYRQMAVENGCTLAELALRFVNRLDGVSVTLIGVSRRQQLEAILAESLGQ